MEKTEMKFKRLRICRFFTLIELIAAMGVFAVIMFILLTFFDSAQKAWSTSFARGEVYENASIAMDLIARDLQCAYYVQDKVPFWHGAYANSSWNEFRANDIIAFVSPTSTPARNDYTTKLCEIKYQKYYAEAHGASYPNDGWLMRSCTGDKKVSDGTNNVYASATAPIPNTTGTWGFIKSLTNFKVARTADGATAFTADNTSSEDWQKVIPHVIELSFICYDKDGTDMATKNYSYDSNGDGVYDGTGPGKSTIPGTPYPTPFPYSIKVSITIMDTVSWNKWVALCNDPYDDDALAAVSQGAIESNTAWELRQRTQRTFSKTIFIGERGQQY